jgi:hypothetical protein
MPVCLIRYCRLIAVIVFINRQSKEWSWKAITARVDFPLHCCFELNRRREYTITFVQVRERYTDGQRACQIQCLSWQTSTELRTKRGNRLWRVIMSVCMCVLLSGKEWWIEKGRSIDAYTYHGIACLAINFRADRTVQNTPPLVETEVPCHPLDDGLLIPITNYVA